MQSKIARPGRFSDWLNRWAIRRGFPALAYIAPRLSRRSLHFGAWCTITVVMFFHWKPKRAIDRNLKRVLGADASRTEVRRARRKMIHNLAIYWADLFRFAQLPRENALEVFDGVHGLEHLDAARASGQGVLLLTAHLGNWELGGLFLDPTGIELSVVYVPDEFEDAEAFRSQWRRQLGVDEIPIQPGQAFGSLPVLRALREGRFVALQGDRDFDDSGTTFDLFGAPVRLPRGPFLLARMSGALVLPTFITYTEDNRFEVHFEPSITIDRQADGANDILPAMECWAEILERAVRRWPTQWYTFFDYWDGSGAAAASGGRVEAS